MPPISAQIKAVCVQTAPPRPPRSSRFPGGALTCFLFHRHCSLFRFRGPLHVPLPGWISRQPAPTRVCAVRPRQVGHPRQGQPLRTPSSDRVTQGPPCSLP